MTSVTTEHRGGARPARQAVAERAEDVLGLVVGVLDDTEFALPVDHVRRILRAPATITPVPGAGPHVLGMMDFAGGVLAVLCPRGLLGLPRRALSRDGRVVALSAAEGTVGLAMDAVREVCRVPAASLVPAATDPTGAVEALCRLEGGRRLLSVLSVARLVAAAGVSGSSPATVHGDGAGRPAEPVTDAGAEAGDDECVLVFRVDREEYAIQVDHVLEISRVPTVITRVPRAERGIRGIVNLRGTALPLIDLRIRLGLAAAPPNAGQRIIVLTLDRTPVGLLVDAVTEVTSFAPGALRPTPAAAPGLVRLFPRVAVLPGARTVLLMRAERLVAGPPPLDTIAAHLRASDRVSPAGTEDGRR